MGEPLCLAHAASTTIEHILDGVVSRAVPGIHGHLVGCKDLITSRTLGLALLDLMAILSPSCLPISVPICFVFPGRAWLIRAFRNALRLVFG